MRKANQMSIEIGRHLLTSTAMTRSMFIKETKLEFQVPTQELNRSEEIKVMLKVADSKQISILNF
jgi:hypothetical protein